MYTTIHALLLKEKNHFKEPLIAAVLLSEEEGGQYI